jgi:hypothetical protein
VQASLCYQQTEAMIMIRKTVVLAAIVLFGAIGAASALTPQERAAIANRAIIENMQHLQRQTENLNRDLTREQLRVYNNAMGDGDDADSGGDDDGHHHHHHHHGHHHAVDDDDDDN